MNYSNKIFGKNLTKIVKEDIIAFFETEQEESEILELKSYYVRGADDYKRKEAGVLKTICGLLNSNGGIAIWGAPKGVHDSEKNTKVFKGDLDPVKKLLVKDNFISKISNRIVPVPPNVQMHPIEISSNEYVYIFEVAESLTKPHQFDSIYYMRLDGQTKPAPHHYVEALFKQIKYPDLGGYIKLDSLNLQQHSINSVYTLDLKIFILNHSPLQNEEQVSFWLLCPEGKFRNSSAYSPPPDYDLNGHRLYFSNFADLLFYGTPPCHNETLVFNPYQLEKTNYEVKLILIFGGKNSPLKTSEYTLNLKNVYPKNMNDLIIEYSENTLMFDLAKEKGTEVEKVNAILGRK